MAIVLLAMGAWTLGCGGGGADSVANPPPPPPSTSVSVNPTNGTVLLGETVQFAATVSNSTDNIVAWSVNGIAGGSAQAGTISADGVYIAPADLPSGGTVQVTATSHADSSKSASASVTVSSDISISLTPNVASVELVAKQAVQTTIHSQGHPMVRWSLSGAACSSSCGSIDSNGSYTAPQILPTQSTVSVSATSVADPSKQSSASFIISSHFSLQLSAPIDLAAGSASSLVAILKPVAGSNPSTALAWSLTGSGCVGSGCGVLSVTTTQAAGGTPLANTAVYTAPTNPPQPNLVLITVTPQADPSKQVQANITIEAGAGVGISPPSMTLAANHRATFSAVQGVSSGSALNWSVNGVAGGNSTLGLICVTGSSPCQSYSGGTAMQVDYVAPGSIPSPNPVSVTVSSAANPSLSASAQITVMNHVVVSVLPNNVTLAPLGVQSFSVLVVGTSNQNVVWQVRGSGCGVAGSCGSVDSLGTYTAPPMAPSPDAIQVVALSQDDSTQSGSASVSIFNGPNIATLSPASVYAGEQTDSQYGSAVAGSMPAPRGRPQP